MSVNGYIARKNGDEDFLSHKNWETLCDIAKECGCFIIGRKTYEAVQKWGEGYSFDNLEVREGVIITKNSDFKIDGNYMIANSPADAISKLKSKGFEKILVSGGSTVNSAFMKEGLIDEIILNVEPFVLGNGIRLFSEEEFECGLELLESKSLSDGIMQFRYKVKKP